MFKKGALLFFTIKTDPVEESKNKTIEDVKPTNGSVNKFFICLLKCVCDCWTEIYKGVCGQIIHRRIMV